MKTLYFIFSLIMLNSCILQVSCDEDFKSNDEVNFKNFEFLKMNRFSASERAIVNKNGSQILLLGNLAGRLDDNLKNGDVISKNKNENIVIVKRNNVILRFELRCVNEIGKMEIDTLYK